VPELLLVGSYRTGHPLLYFVIFPTINARLVEDVGISDLARVGIYSGALEGVAAVVNCAASFPWAFVGDRYGRRPAVIIGSLGAATASILFGFSNDYAVLFVLRALLGLFASAQGALTRVQGVELSDSTNVAQCLVYVSMGL
jgi:MFS family permease